MGTGDAEQGLDEETGIGRENGTWGFVSSGVLAHKELRDGLLGLLG